MSIDQQAEYYEEYTHDEVVEVLMDFVDRGWLELGVDAEGNAIYWPTPEGAMNLGMEMVSEASAA